MDGYLVKILTKRGLALMYWNSSMIQYQSAMSAFSLPFEVLLIVNYLSAFLFVSCGFFAVPFFFLFCELSPATVVCLSRGRLLSSLFALWGSSLYPRLFYYSFLLASSPVTPVLVRPWVQS